MEKISTIPVVAVSPTSIDDDGSKLIKTLRNSGTDSAVAINKLISAARKIDTRLKTVEEETVAINDLSDVTLSSPANLQVLQYDAPAAQWKNATPQPKTVSFCFVYPTTNQYSPYYKFRSNKKITGVTVMAITAPSSQISVNVYKSGANIFSQWFTGQHSQYSANVDVSTDELCFAYISGSPNGANLLTVELTVVDR